MTLDVRGSLKNTKINQNIYIIIDELISNSIDSFLIRRDMDQSAVNLEINISIKFTDKDLMSDSQDIRLECSDNGAGLGDEQTKAFVTKDTSYKDSLSIEGIGKCKGSGRIQYLHYFSNLKVQSVFQTQNGLHLRKLEFDEGMREIDEETFTTVPIQDHEIRTTITLDVIKPDVYKKLFDGKNVREEYSAQALKHYVLVNFLQRFVSLKEKLGEFSITFQTEYKDNTDSETLTTDDLPELTEKKSVNVYSVDFEGKKTDQYEEFSISHYKLDKNRYALPHNSVALCAKFSPVKVITRRYLKTGKLENNPIKGYYHIILIESNYLDSHVNEQRDNFDIPLEKDEKDLFFGDLMSFQEIYDALDKTIDAMITPPEWDKDKIVKVATEKYGISVNMISDANVRIHYGDTEDSVVERVLSTYQKRIIEDTSEIFDIRQQLKETQPHSEDFREKVNELAWKYTSSLKNMDMANLSQLVVRRAAIIEILDLAVGKNLQIQQLSDGERRKDEEVIHNIFFPMRKDSHQVSDHDIWLLNEEYHYYSYIASDMPLSKIKWEGNESLFESDVDEEFKAILEKNYGDNSGKRPDIAIFSKEGSVIIIEFKAPSVNMDNHVGDLMEYSQLLAAKSNGKLKQFYGYLIGTDLNANRLRGYTRFPNGKGWFGTEPIVEHSTNRQLGELYSEILFYEDIVDRANKRLEVYKNKLNVDLH